MPFINYSGQVWKDFFKGSERKDMEAAVLHVSRYPDLPVYSLSFLRYR